MARNSAAPSREILEAALQGLEAQRLRLDEQISEVRALMGQNRGRVSARTGSEAQHPSPGGKSRKPRVLSPEARKRIAAAQKKRWAAFRKGQE
jgi:hypothetical protein